MNGFENVLHYVNNKKHHKTYKVVNAGGMFGSDILSDTNTLYIILKQVYKSGDIIIQLGFNMWKNPIMYEVDNYFSIAELFNQLENRYRGYFNDWVGHLNEIGNQTVAEYIYNILFK